MVQNSQRWNTFCLVDVKLWFYWWDYCSGSHVWKAIQMLQSQVGHVTEYLSSDHVLCSIFCYLFLERCWVESCLLDSHPGYSTVDMIFTAHLIQEKLCNTPIFTLPSLISPKRLTLSRERYYGRFCRNLDALQNFWTMSFMACLPFCFGVRIISCESSRVVYCSMLSWHL